MERGRTMDGPARVALLKQLVEAEAFEQFLAAKFPGTKVSSFLLPEPELGPVQLLGNTSHPLVYGLSQ